MAGICFVFCFVFLCFVLRLALLSVTDDAHSDRVEPIVGKAYVVIVFWFYHSHFCETANQMQQTFPS